MTTKKPFNPVFTITPTIAGLLDFPECRSPCSGKIGCNLVSESGAY